MPGGSVSESGNNRGIPRSLCEFVNRPRDSTLYQTSESRAKFALIVNPQTGPQSYRSRISVHAENTLAYVQSQSLLPGQHWTAEKYTTSGANGVSEIVAGLMSQTHPPTVIGALSGDGTFADVINGIAKLPYIYRPVVLNLPIGTVNVWGREDNLPVREPEIAIRRLFEHGLIRDLDLGDINTRKFLLMASIGFDAHISSIVEKGKHIHKFPAYLLQMIQHLPTYASTKAKIEIGGISHEGETKLLMALFSNTQLYGGVLRPRRGRADDGFLEGSFYTGDQGIQLLTNIPHIMSGAESIPNGFYTKANGYYISMEKKNFYQADGESLGEADEFFVYVEKQALPVLVSSHPSRKYPLFSE